MSALKLVSNPKPMYNIAQEHTKNKNMESKPVNPDRAIDQKLVEKAQKGDKKAFGILVEKYNKKLTRLLSRICLLYTSPSPRD